MLAGDCCPLEVLAMRPTSTCKTAAKNPLETSRKPRRSRASVLAVWTAGLTLGLGLGACAGRKASGNECLDRCTAHAASSLERSSCELDCNRVAAAPTTAPARPVDPLAPGPGEGPRGHFVPPTESTPASPAPTAKTYPQSQISANNPKQPPPSTTGNTVTTPSTPPGPSMAELQRQRGLCESQCDSEGSNTDRATCRIQCAQITDNPKTQPSTGTPAYVNHPTTPPAGQGGAVQPAPADRQKIAQCEAGCNAESVPATDRATCKLNCNAVGSVGAAPSSYYVLHGSDPPPSSRDAVIRSSPGVVQPTTPPSGNAAIQQRAAQCAAQAQQCSTNCGGLLSPCTSGCDQGKLSATDRATCKLTCESNVDVCRDDCRIKEGTCRG
jgi:hypothetical protein